MFSSLDISSSALSAYRTRMNIIANNVANISTTRDAHGNVVPYSRKIALFAAGSPGLPSGEGVRITSVVNDTAPPTRVHDPYHPDAVQSGPDKGYVMYPNVSLPVEMVDMVAATRIYQANVTAFEATKTIISSALRLIA